MSDMETLQQLVQRRMRDLGSMDGQPLSIRQVWLRGGGDTTGGWSYETVRKVADAGHTAIGDKVIDALALALDLPVSQVIAAAGQRVRLGRFTLPRHADRLTKSERDTVLAVIKSILDAADQDRGAGDAAQHIAPTSSPDQGALDPEVQAQVDAIEGRTDLTARQKQSLVKSVLADSVRTHVRSVTAPTTRRTDPA